MTRITHAPIEGEKLALENRPCPVLPNDFVQFAAIVAFIALAWLALCIADWSAPV